jgi:hypothetical protein
MEMSEDVIVDKKDLDAAEQEVLNSSKAKEDEIRKSIESKLRKEMEDKKKAEEEAARIKRLEEENKQMQKMLQEEHENRDKELSELKAQIGASKAIHTQPVNQSKGLNLNDDNVTEIDKNSEEAFLEHYGLPKHWRTGKRK